MKTLPTCLMICLAAFALSGIARADEPMTATQVKEAMIGNTSIGTTSRGGPYWVFRREDGTQAIETDSGFSDEGNWHITEDGQMCSTWEKIRGGEEQCLKYFPLGNDRYRYTRPDGSEADFKVVKGNPENL